jgi:hypothetical protein
LKKGFGPGAKPGPFSVFGSVLIRLELNLNERLSTKFKRRWTCRSWDIRKTPQKRFERVGTITECSDLRFT